MNDDQIIFDEEQQDKEEENYKEDQKEDQQVKKKKKKMDVFKYQPEHLIDPEKGLVGLYKTLGEAKINSINFNEAVELQKYMSVIYDWHYDLVPKYDFDLFMDRTQKLGTSASMINHLDQLRKAHKKIIPWDFLKQGLNDEGDGLQLDQQQQTQNPYLPDQQFLQHIQRNIDVQYENISSIAPSAIKKKIQFINRTANSQQQSVIIQSQWDDVQIQNQQLQISQTPSNIGNVINNDNVQSFDLNNNETVNNNNPSINNDPPINNNTPIKTINAGAPQKKIQFVMKKNLPIKQQLQEELNYDDILQQAEQNMNFDNQNN